MWTKCFESWFSLNWFSLSWQWSESWALGDCWCKCAASLLIGVIVREKIRRSRGEESTKWSLIIDRPTISSPYFPYQLLVSWFFKIIFLYCQREKIRRSRGEESTKWSLIIDRPTISSPYFPFQLLVSWFFKIVVLFNSEEEILGKSACNATKLPLLPWLFLFCKLVFIHE